METTTTTKRTSNRLFNAAEREQLKGMRFTALDYVAGWRISFIIDSIDGCDTVYPIYELGGLDDEGKGTGFDLAPSTIRTLLADGVYNVKGGRGEDNETEYLAQKYTLTK